jgi:hypothetical protein
MNRRESSDALGLETTPGVLRWKVQYRPPPRKKCLRAPSKLPQIPKPNLSPGAASSVLEVLGTEVLARAAFALGFRARSRSCAA